METIVVQRVEKHILKSGASHSRRPDALICVRNHRTDDYLHKASRKIVDYCSENDISKIVIGKNDGWKQGASLPKKANQLLTRKSRSRQGHDHQNGKERICHS